MTDYLSTADTAKLVRAALRSSFPTTTFSVRSSVYSGGSSIRVSWTDGPLASDVDAVVGVFAGSGFDPMIDLKYPVSAVVDQDGKVVGYRSPGSSGSAGMVDPKDDPVPPGGRIVHFGADYVFTNQTLSPDVRDRQAGLLRGLGYDPARYYAVPRSVYDSTLRLALRGDGAPTTLRDAAKAHDWSAARDIYIASSSRR